VADLLAPGGTAAVFSGGRPLISRLVVDAQVAAQRPQLRQAAAGAGIPYLVDPLTPLLQGNINPEDRWAKLPFARAERVGDEELSTNSARQELVEAVVDFQVESGATAVIPPYPYVASPADPWFPIALDLIERTALYMKNAGVHLPVVPVLSLQLQSFTGARGDRGGIDAFVTAALKVDPQFIAVALSPTGTSKDSYDKVERLFAAMRRVREAGSPVMAWHQGIYGPGLVAAGIDGYETGIGVSEQCNVSASMASRRPPTPGKIKRGGAVAGVFLEPLGRSVPLRVAQALLGDLGMRAKVMCDDERCCPLGPMSTLDNRRLHTVRARARQLARLDEMPHLTWRLHRVAREADAAVTLITQANRILEKESLSQRINLSSSMALARVADHLRHSDLDSTAQ
jgi:hypothetical protein